MDTLPPSSYTFSPISLLASLTFKDQFHFRKTPKANRFMDDEKASRAQFCSLFHLKKSLWAHTLLRRSKCRSRNGLPTSLQNLRIVTSSLYLVTSPQQCITEKARPSMKGIADIIIRNPKAKNLLLNLAPSWTFYSELSRSIQGVR